MKNGWIQATVSPTPYAMDHRGYRGHKEAEAGRVL